MWRLLKFSCLWCIWLMLSGLQCTFVLWACKELRLHEPRKKPKLQGDRKETWSKMMKEWTWWNSKLFNCNYFWLYVVLGNNMRWSYNVRNVVALHFVDLNWLVPENNGYPGYRELNPLKLDNLILSSVWGKGAKLCSFSVLQILTCMRAEFGLRVCLHIWMLQLYY